MSKKEQEAKAKAEAEAKAKAEAEAKKKAEADRSLPTTINFAEDAGKGLEGADKDSFAIPFLVVLQPLSPQVVDGEVEGAKAGMLLNSVTNALYPKALIVPCAFSRRWVRWGAREAGGGYKGEMSTAQVNELRKAGTVKELEGRLYYPESDGSVNPNKSDRLADTRNHYVLLLKDAADEAPVVAVFALTSTGIKVSKNLLSRIEGVRLKDGQGKTYNPPSFSHLYSVTTEQQRNEKGTWFTPSIDMVGQVTNPAIYAMAKAFHKTVSEGRVELAHDSVRGEPAAGGGGTDDRM